jgi:hypothetical protein
MPDFPNDTETEQALTRIAERAQHTVSSLTDALEDARNVRDRAQAALKRKMRDDDLAVIKNDSLNMASAVYFAGQHSHLVTQSVSKLSAHHSQPKEDRQS